MGPAGEIPHSPGLGIACLPSSPDAVDQPGVSRRDAFILAEAIYHRSLHLERQSPEQIITGT